MGVDALQQLWPSTAQLYAFPPIAILAQVVQKIRRDGATTLLVTPSFGGSWYPAVMAMGLQAPLLLPQQNLLLGLDGETRTSPRFRTLLWIVSGHRRAPALSAAALEPREWPWTSA
jgi:hypothetical protein